MLNAGVAEHTFHLGKTPRQENTSQSDVNKIASINHVNHQMMGVQSTNLGLLGNE